MKMCILVLVLLVNVACTPKEKNHAAILASTKCEMIEIIMKGSTQNPTAQDRYDAKQKTYDSLYDYYKSIYTDSDSWKAFELEVNKLEQECSSTANTTKKPN